MNNNENITNVAADEAQKQDGNVASGAKKPDGKKAATDGTQKSNSKKAKKILLLIPEIILYVFLALCLCLLVFAAVSKKNADGAASVFGYEMRVVVSASMEKGEGSPDVSKYKIKHLKTKSMVFIKRVPTDEQKAQAWYGTLKVGDVLTFRYKVGVSQETITHRITEITPTETGFIIKLQGDNRSEGASVATQTIYTSEKDYPSQQEIYNYVIGKVVGNSTALGYMVYAVRQPVGMALMIIVPCVIIIVWQVIRITTVLGEDRRKKAASELSAAQERAAAEAAEREKQAAELEELRRKFAELEKQGNGENDHDG